MTTDITEMAQREKFEAWARSQQLSIAYGDCGYVYSSTEMAWRAVKALSAELVEALEKAQRANEHLHEQSAEWERKAISNFEDCAEMSARVEELESQRKLAFTACNRWADKFREAEKRIAELESRTVKLPEPTNNKFWRNDWDATHFMYATYVEDLKVELSAAGIKWEAE